MIEGMAAEGANFSIGQHYLVMESMVYCSLTGDVANGFHNR